MLENAVLMHFKASFTLQTGWGVWGISQTVTSWTMATIKWNPKRKYPQAASNVLNGMFHTFSESEWWPIKLHPWKVCPLFFECSIVGVCSKNFGQLENFKVCGRALLPPEEKKTRQKPSNTPFTLQPWGGLCQMEKIIVELRSPLFCRHNFKTCWWSIVVMVFAFPNIA